MGEHLNAKYVLDGTTVLFANKNTRIFEIENNVGTLQQIT
jgi:hypothetical protein